MAPTFSVVIPTYNQADFLKVALKSVIEQTFQDFEVVIVNNYSTDHTLDVIRRMQDARTRVIDFRNHGVIGAARNLGIRASEGEYIAFLDSDDTWEVNKLEKMAEAAQADSGAGLFCHDQWLVRDGHVVTRSHYGPPDGFTGDLYEYLLFVGNGPSTSATVDARRLLEEAGYFSGDTAFITVEDFDLWLRLAKLCRFRFLREVLGAVHYHSANAADNVELHLSSGLAVLDKHCAELQASPRAYPRRAIRRLYARSFYVAARKSQRMGAYVKSFGYYARAPRTNPFYSRAYAGMCLALTDLVLGQKRGGTVTGALRGLFDRRG